LTEVEQECFLILIGRISAKEGICGQARIDRDGAKCYYLDSLESKCVPKRKRAFERGIIMKTLNVKGVDLSVLSLGTVQLGLNYGINNANGKPSQETANAILNAAIEGGINTLDTAGAYGDSEVVIGNWLKTIPAEKRPFIVTKAVHLDLSSLENLRNDMFARVKASKERLGVKQLDLFMLHHFDQYLKAKDEMLTVMQELKASGEVRLIGASAYSHHDYGELADTGFDATQIPLNLFDWQQIENGGIQKLEQAGMMVFVRSVYLQGLVFQKPESLAPHMEFARPTLEKFRFLCDKYKLAPATLAMSYALSVKGVTSLVLGSETPEQVKQNVELVEQAVELTTEQMAEIRELFLDTPEQVLTPSMWPKV